MYGPLILFPYAMEGHDAGSYHYCQHKLTSKTKVEKFPPNITLN